MLLSAGVGSEREPSSTAQLAGASRGRYKLGDSLCIRLGLSLALVEAVLKKLALGK
jgi:hypothetical protein